jgi:hypothetical protein
VTPNPQPVPPPIVRVHNESIGFNPNRLSNRSREDMIAGAALIAAREALKWEEMVTREMGREPKLIDTYITVVGNAVRLRVVAEW